MTDKNYVQQKTISEQKRKKAIAQDKRFFELKQEKKEEKTTEV